MGKALLRIPAKKTWLDLSSLSFFKPGFTTLIGWFYVPNVHPVLARSVNAIIYISNKEKKEGFASLYSWLNWALTMLIRYYINCCPTLPEKFHVWENYPKTMLFMFQAHLYAFRFSLAYPSLTCLQILEVRVLAHLKGKLGIKHL